MFLFHVFIVIMIKDENAKTIPKSSYILMVNSYTKWIIHFFMKLSLGKYSQF